jgi:hypothetical protein
MQDMQMVIPTGLILDRGYLCHFWRRAFAPLHDFVNRSPSKPDDIAMNLLVQHLSGKGPRNYPQVVDRPGQLPVVTRRRRLAATQQQPRQQPRQLRQLRQQERQQQQQQQQQQQPRQPMQQQPRQQRRSSALQQRQQHQQQQRRRILRPTNNATAAAGVKASRKAYTAESETTRQGRRRLGMSGAAVWPLWRSDGALWTAYFFGGVPPISPGYCNEGVPVAKWKKGCDNSLPKADLPAAYGFRGAVAANDPTILSPGGAKAAMAQPGQLPWEVGAYHGPKALPWLATCNASALFQDQEARLRRQAATAADFDRNVRSSPPGWGEAEGLIVSTTAATANEGGRADSQAQDVWDTVRVIAAMNPEMRVVVTGMRTATPGDAPTRPAEFQSRSNCCRQRVFLRDTISMLRQSLVVETLFSSPVPVAQASAPAALLASEVDPGADEGVDEANGARLLLDVLLRGLLDGTKAFNRTTWLDPLVALPCKGTLLPVPWLRPHPKGTLSGASNGKVAATGTTSAGTATLDLSGVGSEAAAELVFRAASFEAPWVLWADFEELAAPEEAISGSGGAHGSPKPVAAGWAHVDAAQASGALQALRERWADDSAAAIWADVKAVLQEAGWDHLTIAVPSTGLRAAPVRSAALPGACARGFKGCTPGAPCTCPFTDCRVLVVRP